MISLKGVLPLILLGILPCVLASYRGLHLPREFAYCLKRKYFQKIFVTKQVGLNLKFNCWSNYKWHSQRRYKMRSNWRYFVENNPRALRYITNIKNKVSHKNRRGKRQAFEDVRIRKEYRTLTDRERSLFHSAVNKMKTRMEGNVTRYEAFAAYHSGDTQFTAHGGCNFPGWHRIYLLMFEEALKIEEPELPGLPYWDSTLDFYLPDPSQSILWSEEFAGNGDGEVRTGVFGGRTSAGPLTRNVGQSGQLFSEEDIRNITSRTRMEEICGGLAPPEYDLEFKHGPIHIFVDGQMGLLETAAYDPIFFLHHAFVDLIWELFRENSMRAGVDIETDYPTDFGDIFHAPDVILDLEPSLYVSDALQRRFKDGYVYRDRPFCNNANNYNCGSKYLRCVSLSERETRCVSLMIGEDPDPRTTTTSTTSTTTTTTTTTTPRPTTTTTPRPTTPRPTTTPQPPQNCTIIYLPPKPYKPDYSRKIKPRQNTFCANGISDQNQWIYIPVRITLSRPYDVRSYGSHPVVDGAVERRSDIYSPSDYGGVRKYIRPGRPRGYENCHTSPNGVGEIFIQTDGINYQGSFTEYALVDTRLAISMSIAYVAVRKPKRITPTDVLLTGFDHCGRICHPSCLDPGSGRYRPCTGAIRIYARNNKFYGNDSSDSIMNVWNLENDNQCPEYRTDSIYVSFFCDYTNRWPWNDALKQPDPPKPKLPDSWVRKKTPKHNTGQTPSAIQQVPKKLQICQPQGRRSFCSIKRPKCNAPCQNGERFECMFTCRLFSECKNNVIEVKKCRPGTAFNPSTKECELAYRCRNNRWRSRNRNPFFGK